MRRIRSIILAISLAVTCLTLPAAAAPSTHAKLLYSVDTNTTQATAQSVPMSTLVRVLMKKKTDWFVFNSSSARGSDPRAASKRTPTRC